MKIKAKANGDVIDIPEDAANALIEAGIYEAVPEDAPGAPSVVLTKMVTPRTARRPRS
jgi:hypothetical protein